MDPTTQLQRHESARQLAVSAANADREAKYDRAYELYYRLTEVLMDIAMEEKDQDVKDAVLAKATEYCDRAAVIKQLSKNVTDRDSHSYRMDHIDFLLERGLEFDEKEKWNNAYDAYVAGCELALNYLDTQPPNKETLSEKVHLILERIEVLKELMKEEKQKPQPTNTPSTPLLSASETEVLKQASIINSKIYLPWFEDDSTDSFWTQEPFRDPDGFLKLSQEQHEKFGCWKRVSELMANPRMVSRMSSSSIVQDVVTDCSFVASLCVSAAYERKFQKQLITGCIYPQDADGMPLYNMSGKYVVKLFFNGIYRKVVVDDYLPVSKDGKLMCTYSNSLDEVWPCIIEKAYMKVNGGYDFPGSNSGIDLYALTGWIPEQIFINDYKWNAEIQWKRMMSGFKKGRALITLATIDMDEERAIKIGLVPTHAYAVLNIQEADGQRMMQLKNPWNHRRWNGKFSHLDNESWTNGIREALHFDRAKALEHDDGIFWISFDSVLQYFESIHVNWNPAMFSYQHVMHVSWPLEIGPMVDAYTFAHNPQFGLEVNATDDSSTMWLLLSKHVTTKDENKDYITLHIYENTNCHRVYYPDMYSVIHIGAYVNSPHILASIKIPQGKSRYTVVVSQNEKTRSLTFSLRAYGKHPFLFGAIGNEYPEEKEIRHRFKVGSDTKTSDIHVWEQSLTIEAGQICIMTEAQENVTLKLKFVDSKGAVIAESVGGYRPKFAFVEFALPEKGKFQAVVTVTGFSGSNDVNDIEVSLNVRSEGRITWEKV